MLFDLGEYSPTHKIGFLKTFLKASHSLLCSWVSSECNESWMEGLRGVTNKRNRAAKSNNKKLLDLFQAGLEMSQGPDWHSSFMPEMQDARERICHGGTLVGGYEGGREHSNDYTSRRFESQLYYYLGRVFKKAFPTFFSTPLGHCGKMKDASD